MAEFQTYNLGNVLSKAEQIKTARFKNEGFDRQNQMRNVLRESQGQYTPEAINQLNQIDPFQAQKLRANNQAIKNNDVGYKIKAFKWLKLSAPLVNSQKSFSAWRDKAIANGTMTQDDMATTYDESTKAQLKTITGVANKKLSGIKSGMNPNTGKPGFFTMNKANGKVQWLDGPTPIGKKGISVTTKDGTRISIGGDGRPVKLKPGQVLKADVNGNQYVARVTGAKLQTREQSATGQSAQQGLRTIRALLYGGKIKHPTIKGKFYKLAPLYKKDGSVDRALLISMQANIPGTDGRVHRGRIMDLLQAKLRAETGAAAPDSEVKILLQRFMPSVLDKDSGVADKMRMLKDFSTGLMARSNPDLYRSILRSVMKAQGKSEKEIAKRIEKSMRFQGMPPEFDSSLDQEDAKKSTSVMRDSSKMTPAQKKVYLKQLLKANK